MTRDETKALAEELARVCALRLRQDGIVLPGVVPWVEREIRESMQQALDRALTPSRIEAAERDVVEAVGEWRHDNPNSPNHGKRMVIEAYDRLRALREQRKAEECGAEWSDDPRVGSGVTRVGIVPQDMGEKREWRVVSCHLPRGHEGEHEGELGRWRWP